MSFENDFCRRLLLLGSDIVDVEKELSELRNVILDNKEDWMGWAKTELKDLEKTLARIKREYAEMFKTLSNLTKGEQNEIHQNPRNPCGDCYNGL